MRIEDSITKKTGLKTGVSFNGVIDVDNKNDSVLRYLINGIIMFFITYGCIGCFVSSFSISCKNSMLFFVLFILAIAYSFMHINAKAHKIGYIVILISYMYVVFSLKTIIKSGFARIVNETFEKISDIIYVSKVRKYTEYVDDYKMAATMCLIIIGFVMLLILNIVVSEYLNVILTLIITSPIVGVGFYFGYTPSIRALLMYIVAIACLIVMRSNSKINVHNTQIAYDVNEKNDSKIYELTTIPKMHAQLMCVFIVMISLLSGIFTLQLKDKKYDDSAVVTAVKTNLNNKIGKIIAYDVEDGNDISIAGGLSEGRLGNVPSVQFDNEDDLIVNFVPASDETTYLRGYIGSIYKDNRWLTLGETNKAQGSNNLESIKGITKYDRVSYTSNLLAKNYGVGTNNSLYEMVITNVGATEKYVYTPYYAQTDEHYMSINDEDDIKAVDGVSRYTLKYFPYNKQITNTSNYFDINFNEKAYAEFVKGTYTQVPNKNKKVLDKLCSEQGFSAADKNIVNKIQNYFKKEYIYSLKCGTTPDGEDFVNYFIKDKKGFCAHFASTGALILRNLGIPARYVEGYVITSDVVAEAKEYGSREDYIIDDGKNNTAKPVEVAIKDNKAHAWIEVYKNGFGWVPYEMTYYSRREDATTADDENKEVFKDINIFDTFVTEVNSKIIKFVKGFKEYGMLALVVIFGAIMIAVLAVVIRLLITRIKRNREFNTPKYKENVTKLAKYFFKACGFFGCKKEDSMTIDEYLSLLYNESLVTKDMLRPMSWGLKKASYSTLDISEEEYRQFKEDVENIIEIQYNELSLKDKFIFRIVYNL